MSLSRRLFLLGSTAVVVSGCEDPPEESVEAAPRPQSLLPIFSPPSGFTRLRLGLVPFLSKETMLAAHQRLADHLSKTLSVPVELHAADSYADAIERMASGEFDVVELSPLVYAQATTRLKLKALVQTIADGSTTASGYIFVRDDSPRRTIEDLRGASFGFVDPMSTSGSLLAKKVLKDRGLDWKTDLSRSEYLGNHEAVLMAVLEGRVDAGATYQGSFAALRRAKGVDPLSFRVIAKTIRTPRDIFCVRPELSTEISDAVASSLLALNGRDRAGREILGPLSLNGFRPADDHSYDEVRAIARELGEG